MTETPTQIHRKLRNEGGLSFEEVCLQKAIDRGDKKAEKHWRSIINNTPFLMILPKRYLEKL